jgi:hypothetical protein
MRGKGSKEEAYRREISAGPGSKREEGKTPERRLFFRS